MSSLCQLTYHHTGLLVESIEVALQHYAVLFGQENVSEVYTVTSQKVRVCFVQTGTDSFLELVEPMGEDSVVNKMMGKRISYYHVAYMVDKIADAIKSMEDLNYKAFEIFNSEAFGGKRCVFLFTPEAHLVELIEN